VVYLKSLPVAGTVFMRSYGLVRDERRLLGAL